MFIILMIFVIALNVCGHVFLKIGMNQVGVMGSRSITEFGIASITNIFVLIGLAGYVSSVAGYIVVLSKTQLSVAYPILMSTGYALVVLGIIYMAQRTIRRDKMGRIGIDFIRSDFS